MVVVVGPICPLGMNVKKKLGNFGDPDPLNLNGIYQVRTRGKHQTQVKEKFYVPTNPQSIPQQANRQKLANGVIAWQALSDSEKQAYNKRATRKPFFGYHLFLREYMLS